MSIEQKIEGNIGKLFLADEIDLDKSPLVRENLKELMDKVKIVEVQLSKVKYIDSSGIAALVEGMQLAKSSSKEFYLTDVSNEVMKVIKLAHLDKFFQIKSATGKDALEGSSSQPVEQVEEAAEASENVDLNPSEENNQKEVEENKTQSDETQPSIKRDDDDGDKIKFKR
ncbi:STAS domain-containing protein [Candidatus Pelagibacter sp.]|uniref:STAS domain-containing protein n=1 Tax=Candidatus Pelagibacter sp. TaxID=2024849 RepID=UPI003F86869B